MGANAQVALEKFARYFDVECRLVPVSKESRYCLGVSEAMKYVDENTIGVFVILGSEYWHISAVTIIELGNRYIYGPLRAGQRNE